MAKRKSASVSSPSPSVSIPRRLFWPFMDVRFFFWLASKRVLAAYLEVDGR